MEEPTPAYHPGKADPKPTTHKGRGGKKVRKLALYHSSIPTE
jgi:hypothetical protein